MIDRSNNPLKANLLDLNGKSSKKNWNIILRPKIIATKIVHLCSSWLQIIAIINQSI